MALRSLRARFVTVFFGLVLLLTTVGLSTVDYAIEHNARAQLSAELATSERVLHRLLDDRRTQLEQAAKVLAADFAFRAAVATGDRETVASALANHGERIGATLMTMLDRHAHVTASTAAALPAGTTFPHPTLLEQARSADGAAGLMVVDGRLFQTVLVPVKAPTTIGWVAMGFGVDASMARELGALTSTSIAFVIADALDTLRFVGQVPPGAHAALDLAPRAPYERADTLLLVSPLADGPQQVYAVLHVPLATALTPYMPLQRFLMALAGGALLATAFGSALIARGITRPLRQLANVSREYAEGDYRRGAVIERDDEVGALATALNAMRDGIAAREARISELAFRDPETGLPNRAAFVEDAAHALAGDGPSAVLLLIGIDNLRYVTHTLGHAFAARLLVEVARRLTLAIGTHPFARLGADQFALLLAPQTLDTALRFANELVVAMEAPFRVEEQFVDLGASIGIVASPVHGTDVSVLLQRAELALGEARRTRTDCAVYEPRFDQGPERLSLLGELRRAVEERQLVLYYQPKIDLASGEPAYVEALLRWQHPTKGFIPPDQFIPFAEQTGYIRVLTQWVLDTALRQAAAWRARGIRLRMCINLSARDLLHVELPARVGALLQELELPPSTVWLEITESAIMDDPVRAEQTLAALDALGVRLSIDDFGTGYSSLAYLKRLPVDELKIDKSFVLTMDRDASDATIVRSTVELGHNLGLSVVAEGVDSERTLALLREWGCDVAQGFLICKPLPPADLEAWLASDACRRFRQRVETARTAQPQPA